MASGWGTDAIVNEGTYSVSWDGSLTQIFPVTVWDDNGTLKCNGGPNFAVVNLSAMWQQGTSQRRVFNLP